MRASPADASTAAELRTSHDVSGIVTFSGEAVGSVVLSFPIQTAQLVVAALTGAPVDPSHPLFADAIGELTNMVAGSGKSHLGVTARITVPSVVFGAGLPIQSPSNAPCVLIPFTAPAGEFVLEVNIMSANPASA
jgi:chemotaxis protein CheX